MAAPVLRYDAFIGSSAFPPLVAICRGALGDSAVGGDVRDVSVGQRECRSARGSRVGEKYAVAGGRSAREQKEHIFNVRLTLGGDLELRCARFFR